MAWPDKTRTFDVSFRVFVTPGQPPVWRATARETEGEDGHRAVVFADSATEAPALLLNERLQELVGK